MRLKNLFSRTFAFMFLSTSLSVVSQPTITHAGCGCDKPPPAPAAVVPNAAFSGMPVTLFHPTFQVGQTWQVTFQNNTTTVTVEAPVVWKRDLTAPMEEKYTSQLVVSVPNMPVGPTRIVASTTNDSLVVLEESFTVIAKPVVVAEQSSSYQVKQYTTGVGADGVLYISVGGLSQVCSAMDFGGFMKGYPLRFEDGDVAISNTQGFLVEALDEENIDHFFITPKKNNYSNHLNYFRHSFEKYCADHQPGGAKEVDSQDPNWHLDGTPHVDYSTLIFAIAGSFEDGSWPQPGSASFDLIVESEVVEDE
jgi:hypothetical protein